MKSLFKELPKKGILLASVIGIAVTVVLLVIEAALMAYDILPYSLSTPLALGAVFVGGLACSFIAASGKRKLLSALFAVVIMFAVMFLLGGAIFNAAINTLFLTLVLIILLFSCIIGSVISTAIR